MNTKVMNTVDGVLEKFDYEEIWSDLLYLEENASWPGQKKPDWMKAVQESFNMVTYANVFISAAYRHVALRALRDLKAERDAAPGSVR